MTTLIAQKLICSECTKKIGMVWNKRRRSSNTKVIVCNDCIKKKTVTSWLIMNRKLEETIQSNKELKQRWYQRNKERILVEMRERREAARNHPCACGCGGMARKTYIHGHRGRGRRYFRQGLVSDIENVLLLNSQS